MRMSPPESLGSKKNPARDAQVQSSAAQATARRKEDRQRNVTAWDYNQELGTASQLLSDLKRISK
jgi:hypothetical protein